MTYVIEHYTAWQMLAALCAAALAFGFVCRLIPGTWLTVKARFQIFHLVGLAYCGAVIFQQPEGAEVLGEFLGLAFCAGWLWISYPTWKCGMPEHASRSYKEQR